MWEIHVTDQAVSFGIALLTGAVFCLFYDLFRLFRLEHKFGAAAIFLQDVFYWTTCGFAAFCCLLARCNGAVRSYMLFGMLVGFVLCRLTLSVLLLKLLRPVVRFVIRLKRRLARQISRFFAAVGRRMGRSAAAGKNFFRKIFKNIQKVAKKGLKPGGEMVYNQADNRRKNREGGAAAWRKGKNRKRA